MSKGNTLEAKAIAAPLSLAAKLHPILGVFSAAVEAELGNEEKAIDALEKVYNDQVAYCKFPRFLPRLRGNRDNIYSNPRYQALLKKMNLDDASIADFEQTVDF